MKKARKFKIFVSRKFPSLTRLYFYVQKKIIYSKTRIIFVHIAKAAGSSVSKALYGKNLGHANYTKLFNQFGKNYSYITVVREPHSRLASALSYAISKGTNEGIYTGPSLTEKNYMNVMDDYLTKYIDEDRDPIFRSQSSYFFSNIKEFDFICTTDHLGLLESYLQKRNVFFSSKEIKNKNYKKFTPEKNFVDYLVNKYYQLDVRMFKEINRDCKKQK